MRRSYVITYKGFWYGENRSIEVVKAICRVSGELNMLLLILSHRDVGSPTTGQLCSLTINWFQTCKQVYLQPEELGTRRGRVSASILLLNLQGLHLEAGEVYSKQNQPQEDGPNRYTKG